MSVHEKTFFDQIRRKYGVSKLSLVTDADEKPSDGTRNLRDVVDEHELQELKRFNHVAFGSVAFTNDRGEDRFARMRISWT